MAVNTISSETQEYLRDEDAFKRNLRSRHFRGRLWRRFFQLALVAAFLALIALFFNILNSALGYVVEDYAINPITLAANGDLGALPEEELVMILVENRANRLPVYVRDYLYAGDPAVFTTLPLSALLSNTVLPAGTADLTIRELSVEQQAELLLNNIGQPQLIAIVEEQVIEPTILQTWSLTASLFERDQIEAEFQENYAAQGATLFFKSWINLDFLTSPMSSNPAAAGARTAILGTLYVVIVTIFIAFPIGVGAAIYLEEYTSGSQNSRTARINRLIETNIRNLAGVPSIIYGLLGLAIFVRALSPVTGGRTIISAALTMALLILPVIIINAQEAIRAVPSSLREASYGLGATRWQTIYKVVLPSALPGILTGTILGMSRAIGETAPLIIIGASTFILFDPTGLQSKFTVLPILIYNWTSRPQDEYRAAAAAGIIVLLILLLILNATAIILRQRARRSLTA